MPTHNKYIIIYYMTSATNDPIYEPFMPFPDLHIECKYCKYLNKVTPSNYNILLEKNNNICCSGCNKSLCN